MPSENPHVSFQSMTPIGFSAEIDEAKELRRALSELDDVIRNVRGALMSMSKEDLRLAGHHVRAAEWHASQAKESVVKVGQNQPDAKDHNSKP